MSVNLNRTAGLEPPGTTLLDGTNPVTIHTASTKFTSVVEAIAICNTDSGAYVITLHWVDATPTSHPFWKKSVAASTTEIIDNLPITTSGVGSVRSITATAASDPNNAVAVTVITSVQSRAAPGVV